MQTPELYRLFEIVLASIHPGELSDEAIEQLSHFFPDTLLLSALDLIDRECVIKYLPPWGRPHFHVLGSTGTYTVYPSLPLAPHAPAFCSCPAFSYAVLISGSQLMCKHVLAARLAERLARCVERQITSNDFASLLARQQASM
ncbi:hypothetical protein FA95DRAFT_1563089 [Auriscalpium vulgare]|uniref:Uncharacterized protein n=1 Tax=Auriscalpium vulgare TaxID=40419 RepID=A0ACB8RJ93_9AGAM|nr:hypothetical protein FA95DRAFT_1563089 [Auriscalpium vulgare]